MIVGNGRLLGLVSIVVYSGATPQSNLLRVSNTQAIASTVLRFFHISACKIIMRCRQRMEEGVSLNALTMEELQAIVRNEHIALCSTNYYPQG